MRDRFFRFIRDKRGVSALEYGLITAAIAVGISVSIFGLGNKIANMLNKIGNAL